MPRDGMSHMDHRVGVSPMTPLQDGQSPHTPAAQVSALPGRSHMPRQHPSNIPPYPMNQPNRQSHPIPQVSQPSPYPAGTPTQPYVTPHNFPHYQAPRIPVPPMAPQVYNPNAPKPVETFHLQDSSNARVPPDIRQNFQCDEQGRLLFFSTPPLDIVSNEHQGLGHSIRYLAAKEERKKRIAERKAALQRQQQEAEAAAKRQKTEDIANEQERIKNLEEEAWKLLTDRISQGTKDFYKIHYGDNAEAVMAHDSERLRQVQAAAQTKAAKAKGNSSKRSWLD